MVYFHIVTCIKEEFLNILLMLMNYTAKHAQDHAASEYEWIRLFTNEGSTHTHTQRHKSI